MTANPAHPPPTPPPDLPPHLQADLPATRQADPLLASLAAAQAQHTLFANPSSVVVGVSGGADSVCLLHALRQFAPAWNLRLHVAHVNHGLRAEADAEEAFVAGLCQAWDVPFAASKLEPDALRTDPLGLEAAARAARYAFFAQVAGELVEGAQPVCVATAHHADDQAETVLMHLLQGSGLRGLGGLRPVSALPHAALSGPSIRLVRPLLGATRGEILAYLQRWGLAWREDASNAELHHTRNRLRHRVLSLLAELNPNVVETLARTAEVLAAEAERTEAWDAQALHALAAPGQGTERVVLDYARWRALPLAAQRGVLRAALAKLNADGREVGFRGVEQVVRNASPRTAGPHPLTAALAWSTVGAAAGSDARLCLHKSSSPPVAVEHPWLGPSWRVRQPWWDVPLEGAVSVGGWRLEARCLEPSALPPGWQADPDRWRLYADAGSLGKPALTVPAPGMRLAPLGMQGRHKRVVDLLSDHKIPPVLRAGWPILFDRATGRVLWVCGIRAAEDVRIAPDARRVVCLTWARE